MGEIPPAGCGAEAFEVTRMSAVPRSARVSTTSSTALYLGHTGVILGNPRSRSWVRKIVRSELRVARTAAEKRRVMRVWREIHYLGRGQADPIGIRQIRLSYYLDLPCLRPQPEPWIPAACVTIRYALPAGIPDWLGLDSPLQALEIARSFVADDLRWPHIADFSPAVLREVVRRIRQGDDWREAVRGRVLWEPRWLLSYADPAVGHDGGVYRGAGARFLGETSGGKLLFGWPVLRAVS